MSDGKQSEGGLMYDDWKDKKLKIYSVDFECVWPVGCCLILTAYNSNQARRIAQKQITHTDKFKVKEIKLDKPKTIKYLSGEY